MYMVPVRLELPLRRANRGLGIQPIELVRTLGAFSPGRN